MSAPIETNLTEIPLDKLYRMAGDAWDQVQSMANQIVAARNADRASGHLDKSNGAEAYAQRISDQFQKRALEIEDEIERRGGTTIMDLDA